MDLNRNLHEYFPQSGYTNGLAFEGHRFTAQGHVFLFMFFDALGSRDWCDNPQSAAETGS